MTTQSGILVVDKPSGWTSHQVVGRCRRLLGTRKVGHAGTLDPMATGVLVVGVNRATRLLGHLALHDKRYWATVRLGVETVTEDADGDVTATRGAAGIAEDAVRAAMQPYIGDITQVPSAVSAIKVDGKRSYARVRAGEDVVLKARPVTVSRYDLLAVRPAEVDGVAVVDLDVDVECSSGTYIRALARDLGNELGTGAHLTSLRRTRVGGYSLDDVTIDVTVDPAEAPEPELMSMADAAARSFPVVQVDDASSRAVSYGKPLDLTLDRLTGILDPQGALLALYRPGGDGRAVPEAVLTEPEGNR